MSRPVAVPALLASAALAFAANAQDRAAWTPVPLPALCAEPEPLARLPRLLSGSHLAFYGDSLERDLGGAGAELPLRGLLDFLQEDARAGGRNLRIFPGAPPVLVQGDDAAVSNAVARAQELDAAAAGMRITLRAWLLPTAGPDTTHPARADFERAVGTAAPWGERVQRSGELALFGRRSEQGFLGAWTPEVATSSGVAEPRLVRALTGETLHLRASRAGGGARVVLDGFLDLAELGEVETLQPTSPDLGVIQQPRLRAVQVAFSGSVESGGLLAVSLRGTPLAKPDWTLWIEARTSPDAAGGAWRPVDVAWLENPALALPQPSPGAGLEAPAFDSAPLAPLSEALAAGALAQAIEDARGSIDRKRAALAFGNGLLLVPRADAAAIAALDALLAAAERSRLGEVQLVLRQGAFSALVPALEGRALRVLAGNERTVVAGYGVELAAETWMPSPHVERVFDGLCVQARCSSGRAQAAAWSASSEITATLSREEARLGRMQLLKRAWSGERAALVAGEPARTVIAASAGLEALSLELRSR